jgi:hypothetical protein
MQPRQKLSDVLHRRAGQASMKAGTRVTLRDEFGECDCSAQLSEDRSTVMLRDDDHKDEALRLAVEDIEGVHMSNDNTAALVIQMQEDTFVVEFETEAIALLWRRGLGVLLGEIQSPSPTRRRSGGPQAATNHQAHRSPSSPREASPLSACVQPTGASRSAPSHYDPYEAVAAAERVVERRVQGSPPGQQIAAPPTRPQTSHASTDAVPTDEDDGTSFRGLGRRDVEQLRAELGLERVRNAELMHAVANLEAELAEARSAIRALTSQRVRGPAAAPVPSRKEFGRGAGQNRPADPVDQVTAHGARPNFEEVSIDEPEPEHQRPETAVHALPSAVTQRSTHHPALVWDRDDGEVPAQDEARGLRPTTALGRGPSRFQISSSDTRRVAGGTVPGLETGDSPPFPDPVLGASAGEEVSNEATRAESHRRMYSDIHGSSDDDIR